MAKLCYTKKANGLTFCQIYDTLPKVSPRPARTVGSSTIQIRAFCKGAVSYGCLVCGALNRVSQLNIRFPRHKCAQCRRPWQLGLAIFTDKLPNPVPYNGWVSVKPLRGATANTLDDATGEPTLADVQGRVTFQCPKCRQRTTDEADYGLIECQQCHQTYGVGVRLWRQVIGRHWHAPLDWIIPGGPACLNDVDKNDDNS